MFLEAQEKLGFYLFPVVNLREVLFPAFHMPNGSDFHLYNHLGF